MIALWYLLLRTKNISPLFPISPVTAEDPPTQLFHLLSQCKMQYRIRAQIQNLLALRKIHFCRLVQSYHYNELPSGPSINKSKCIIKSIWFFAMLHLHHFLVPAVQTEHTRHPKVIPEYYFVCIFAQRLQTWREKSYSSRSLRMIVTAHAKVATACC